MKRRGFIMGATSAAATWPAVARPQSANVTPLIAVTAPLSGDDPEVQARMSQLRKTLAELGWIVGRNVRIEYRWSTSDPDRNRRNAAELAGLAPSVILATGSPTLEPLLQATRTVPIVFVQVADPVGAGLIESLSRPGGNATGFTTSDYTSAGKWVELLKEIAPTLKRALLFRDPNTGAGIGLWGASLAVAERLGIELRPVNVSAVGDIERSIAAFGKDPDAGMIVTTSGASIVHRELIVELAARHHLPAVYPFRLFVDGGGLVSYGSDSIDIYRRAAGYIDRILKGTKPNDLPVQNPTKFELVINLKTAKALGLAVPPSLLARADEVIE